jgi:hypothetical protein
MMPAWAFDQHAPRKMGLHFLHQAQSDFLDFPARLDIARIYHLIAEEFVRTTEPTKAKAVCTHRSCSLAPNQFGGQFAFHAEDRSQFIQKLGVGFVVRATG